MSNIRINPDKDSLLDYIVRFQEGKIQVPAFQRNFVWSTYQKIELLESIERGYPIGSVILWQPDFNQDEELYKFESESIGSYTIPTKRNDFFYILDGFQRLSTLFGCLINPSETNLLQDKELWFKEFNIVYDLESKEGDDNFELSKKRHSELEYYKIPVYQLIDPKFFYNFQRKLIELKVDKESVERYLDKFEKVSKAIQKYELPSINIYGGNLAEAVDIFQRLNSRGTPISPDWIVSGLSFNKDRGFKLGVAIDELLENLTVYNFQNQNRSVILKCITNSFGSVYFDMPSKGKKLEELARRDDFIDKTLSTLKSVGKAVKFLFEELFVLNSKLLPYNSQLIFITEFLNQVTNPTKEQLTTLKKWFWITTYSNYFTRYNLSKQRIAYNSFQEFIKDETISPVYYERKEPFETLEFPEKINMGSVRAKALALFMLEYQAQYTIIDNEMLNGFKTYKLFKYEGNVSENTVLVFDDGIMPIPKSTKELSHWLTLPDDHFRFFITEEMKIKFQNGISPKEILNDRKLLLLAKEKIFVEQLGLFYS